MALSKKPVNGMKDILPAEMEIRDYVTSVIKDTYRSFGFTPIETPCMENIANLSNKQGGENEKLIFKVLKRGEKLNLETAKEEADVVDFVTIATYCLLFYEVSLFLFTSYINTPAVKRQTKKKTITVTVYIFLFFHIIFLQNLRYTNIYTRSFI